MFDTEDLSLTPQTVHAVQISWRAKKDDAATREVRSRIRSDAATADGATRTLTSSYLYYHDVFEEDPDAAGPWTGAAARPSTPSPRSGRRNQATVPDPAGALLGSERRMSHQPDDHRVAGVAHWLIAEARLSLAPLELIGCFCHQLVELGVPLWRLGAAGTDSRVLTGTRTEATLRPVLFARRRQKASAFWIPPFT